MRPCQCNVLFTARTLYVFGYHHSLVDGKVQPRKVKVHRYGKLKAKSGVLRS